MYPIFLIFFYFLAHPPKKSEPMNPLQCIMRNATSLLYKCRRHIDDFTFALLFCKGKPNHVE